MALKIERTGRFAWNVHADGWQGQLIFWSCMALAFAAGRWL